MHGYGVPRFLRVFRLKRLMTDKTQLLLSTEIFQLTSDIPNPTLHTAHLSEKGQVFSTDGTVIDLP